ncbi:hypothetical protein SUGI_0978540 [Cryptomeria japonica]|nr:hypothetical protein SUGI_0978540 [Cryptomeria japonica]
MAMEKKKLIEVILQMDAQEEFEGDLPPPNESELVGGFYTKMGLDQDYPNKDTPECGKVGKRRGRKSLNELRTLVGAADDQTKITALFNVGKGKKLPTVQ